jgi:hypothetical protein
MSDTFFVAGCLFCLPHAHKCGDSNRQGHDLGMQLPMSEKIMHLQCLALHKKMKVLRAGMALDTKIVCLRRIYFSTASVQPLK